MDRTATLKRASSLSGIRDVQIGSGVAGNPKKFIMVKVSEGATTKLIFKSERLDLHSDIYNQMLGEIDQTKLKLNVMGGGKVYLNLEEKTIWLWGLSMDFGPPEYKDAKVLLQKGYPDFNITIIPELENGHTKDVILDYIYRGDTYELITPLERLGLNTQIVDGKTALQIAVDFGRAGEVQDLLDLGVNPAVKDDNGLTALEAAETKAKKDESTYSPIVKILKMGRATKVG